MLIWEELIFGLGKVRVGIIEITAETATPQNSQTTQDTIDKLIHVIQSVLTEDVQAIGIGVPSVDDRKKGIVYNVVNIPHWDEVPLKDILESHFSISVSIDNDANCFTLGERWFGVGKEFENFVGLTLGT